MLLLSVAALGQPVLAEVVAPEIGCCSVAPTSALDDLARVCRSFSGETEVLMADGTTKPISDIEVGDEVWAADPETGEAGNRTVTAVWPHQDWLLDFAVEGGSITTTEDHHFWNATDAEWQETQHIDRGDDLLTAEGHLVEAGNLDWASSHYAAAYDLTVEGLHTYFVGAGAGEVLVHNTNCGRWGNSGTLTDHFNRHGADFGAASESQYSALATDFFDSRSNFLTKTDPNTGVVRVYDSTTNSFGSFNPNGTTKTFYKPNPSQHGYATNWDYWSAQAG